MIILNIIYKELKQCLRDFKTNILMVIFPIVLIVILGAAFSGVFENSIDIEDVNVLYTIDIEGGDPVFENAFSTFCEYMSDETGMQFEETADVEKGISEIENHRYTAYLHITGDPPRIDMYRNKNSGFESGIVENAVASFLESYAAINVIVRNDPAALSKIQQPDSAVNSGYVRVTAIDRKKQPGSTDYYAVTMLTLILLYSSLTGFWSIRSEADAKTGARVLCAPVQKYQYLTGKILGSISVTIVQAFVVLLFSKLVLKANWGEDLLTVAVLIITYAIMTVSLGAALAFIFRTAEVASGLLNTIIPVFVFLGGGYVPLSMLGDQISKVSVISPVRWINMALINIIYEGTYSAAYISLAVNLGLSILFISVAAWLSGRRKNAYA